MWSLKPKQRFPFWFPLSIHLHHLSLSCCPAFLRILSGPRAALRLFADAAWTSSRNVVRVSSFLNIKKGWGKCSLEQCHSPQVPNHAPRVRFGTPQTWVAGSHENWPSCLGGRDAMGNLQIKKKNLGRKMVFFCGNDSKELFPAPWYFGVYLSTLYGH